MTNYVELMDIIENIIVNKVITQRQMTIHLDQIVDSYYRSGVNTIGPPEINYKNSIIESAIGRIKEHGLEIYEQGDEGLHLTSLDRWITFRNKDEND